MAEEQKLSILDKFNLPLKTLWTQYRGFLIGFSILILIFKFREVIIDLLVSSVHKQVDNAKKQDTELRKEENSANAQADLLRKQAEELAQSKDKIDEDWYKKNE